MRLFEYAHIRYPALPAAAAALPQSLRPSSWPARLPSPSPGLVYAAVKQRRSLIPPVSPS